MMTRVCPYLGAFDDPGVRFSAPHAANACYAVSSRAPAQIPLGFQGSTCLAGQSGRCARYRAAEARRTRRFGRRLLVAGGGVVTLVGLAGCAFLAVVALILATVRPGFVARTTDTPQPTATATPTLTATTSPTPTVLVTNTATATLQPVLPSPTASPASISGGEFVSPLSTPMLPPTATQPRPTATRRPRPATSQRPLPTSTRAPTSTPAATSTPRPTVTPLMACRVGDTMTFNPASPTTGKTFIIEVRSLMGYANVGLTGAGSPDFNGVDSSGSYYIWRWEDRLGTAGTYTYSFTIRLGAETCVTKAVTVLAPTNTPTPTPTVAPVYGLDLTLVGGDDFRPIYTDTQPVIFELDLTNTGNVTDAFEVGLDADPPQDWTAQYCIGDACSDHTASGAQVTLPEGGSQRLSIKLQAAPGAQAGDTLSAALWVRSLGDETKQESKSVTVVVTSLKR